MYEAYYNLKENPFSIQPDPDFLYFSTKHAQAYAMMEYGIKNKSGFIVITGEIGCGKTTLIRHLLNNLPSEMNVGLVFNTHSEIANLLEWIMLAFGLPYEGMSTVALYDAFQRFLIEQYGLEKGVLLIIDEAQNLSSAALESLRMLSNINADKHQLLQIMLVGQPQLRNLLMQPELTQLTQRIELDFYLKPFSEDDVRKYIEHRLAIAGRETPLFTSEACARIAEASQCVPRRINVLCNLAMVYGFAAESEFIGLDPIEEVIRDKAESSAFTNKEPTQASLYTYP